MQDENIVFDDGADIIINQEDESLHNDSGDITDEEEDPDKQIIDFAPETADQRIDKKIQKLEERELK